MTIIQKLCCFFLFAKILLYLCPDETYETYFSLLLNWSLFFVIVTGVLAPQGADRLLAQGEETYREMMAQMESFREQMDENLLEQEIQDVVDEELLGQIREEEDVEKLTIEQEEGNDTGRLAECEEGERATDRQTVEKEEETVMEKISEQKKKKEEKTGGVGG